MIVWSYGGGTQSAAIAVLILTGKLPKPDIVVMADTSREVTETWEYLHRIVQPALSDIGLTVEIVNHDYATVDLQGTGGDVLLPAFTRKFGAIGKMPTFCSNEWKQRPIRRWLRERGVASCDLWLGISTDEIERMKYSDVKWLTNVYPLIEILPTSRHQCRNLVLGYGWPEPPKSRCWMCPNMSPQAWKELFRKYPVDFQKAVDLEADLREKDKDLYLHPLAEPLEQAIFKSSQQSDMFDGCDSGFCWT